MAKLVIRTEGLPLATLKLKGGVNRIGRSSRNDFPIEHDSISRFHAEIELNDQWMAVRDMDSSNGVFVNDEQVDQCPLESGQVLRLGDVSLEVQDAPVLNSGGELSPCENHPETAATLACQECHRKFCGACVHLLGQAGDRMLQLCPACSGHCEPLTGMTQDTQGRLTKFIRKLLNRKKPVSLLPARVAAGELPAGIVAGPSCDGNIIIPAEVVENLSANAKAWQQRALAAEQRAECAHAIIRAGVLPQLADWLKQQFIQGLVSQRSQILDAQKSAAAELAELERRLDEMHAPLQERMRAYESRIAELEKMLAAKGEENRELLRARIEMSRRQLESTRTRNALEFN